MTPPLSHVTDSSRLNFFLAPMSNENAKDPCPADSTLDISLRRAAIIGP